MVEIDKVILRNDTESQRTKNNQYDFENNKI